MVGVCEVEAWIDHALDLEIIPAREPSFVHLLQGNRCHSQTAEVGLPMFTKPLGIRVPRPEFVRWRRAR